MINSIKASNPTNFILLLIISSLFIFNSNFLLAANNEASTDIAVKDYTWRSSGTGRAAILKDITLKNLSAKDYKDIEFKIELYSRENVPLGTLRGSINEILPAGEELTFKNIHLGIMNTDLQRSNAKIVRAELSGQASLEDPRKLILIKDWKFEGGNYSTEGFIKEITIENKSDKHFKNVVLTVSDFATKGSVGLEDFVTKVTIHKILPAKTTRTFKNINIGFSHPDVKEKLITVSDASIITSKELRYLLAKDDKEKKEVAKDLKSSNIVIDERDYEEIDRKLTLAQRYQKKLAEKQKNQKEIKRIKPQDLDPEDRKDSEDLPVEKKKIETIEEYERYLSRSSDNAEAFPKSDIEVLEFVWGSGVPGTMGIIKKLVLKNVSTIAYTKIELELTFVSPTKVKLGSNQFRLYEVLPPNGTKEFKNVKIGIIHSLPNQRDMNIKIINAERL